MSVSPEPSWIDLLDDEDRAFVKRFILCSGSLKELAAAYDVSYPTVRLRLDRLIEKIRIVEQSRSTDPFERLLRANYADGKLEDSVFKKLLGAYQTRKKEG